jgi:hypothetical protein
MQRRTSLRIVLASSTSDILLKAHASGVGHGNARADPAPIRLYAQEDHLDEMVVIPVVFEKPMESE